MNGNEKYLIDTNILIYFFDGLFSEIQKQNIVNIFENSFNISIISKIEFLGFRDFLDIKKFQLAKDFVNIAHTSQCKTVWLIR